MIDFSEQVLGKSTTGQVIITTREENTAATLEMIRQAKQKIAIISQELDPYVYDQLDFREALKQLVLNNRFSEVRIIVFKPEIIVRRGHMLLDLGNRLSSFIRFKKVAKEYRSFNEAVLIADDVGFVFRENIERYRGKVNFNSRSESKSLLDVFDNMWEASKPDPNLRRVII